MNDQFTSQDSTTALLPPTQLPAWGWKEIVKVILSVIVGSLLVSVVILGLAIALGMNPESDNSFRSAPLFGVGAAIYLLLLTAIYWFGVRRAVDGWRQMGIRPFELWWLAAAPAFTVLQLLGMAFINTQLVMRLTGEAFVNPQVEAITGGFRLTPRDLVLLLLLIAVLAPIAEELFFRGMLYPLLRKRWGAAISITLNALLFALVHFIPMLLPGLFFVGLVLAWVRERSQSVLPCIVIHALQNGIVMVGIYQFSLNGIT